jgi:hypothetical protein
LPPVDQAGLVDLVSQDTEVLPGVWLRVITRRQRSDGVP